MRSALLAAVIGVLLPAPGPVPDEGDIVVERSVQLVLTDVLNRRREIHRKEVVRVRGADVAIKDLTFGEILIVRSGLRKVWKADPLAGTFSELSFDEVAAHRKRAVGELRAARARLLGTADEEEIRALLEGLDEFDAEPRVELRSSGASREVVVNGDRLRASVEVDDRFKADGYFEALSNVGAFHPAISAKIRAIGGFPRKGTLRYVLFLDRVVERFEVLSIRREEPSDAEFEPPKGLRRVPLPGFEPEAERRPAVPDDLRTDFKEDEVDRRTSPLRAGEKNP